MTSDNVSFLTWDNDIRKYIGRQIAEMRNKAGLSQVELAEKSGVGSSHIARIEQGRYSVGIDILQKIAGVFGMRVGFVEPKLKMLEITSVQRKLLIHSSGVKGVFLKAYTPTGHQENIIIECSDGLKFHAPANEFKEIVSQKPHEIK